MGFFDYISARKRPGAFRSPIGALRIDIPEQRRLQASVAFRDIEQLHIAFVNDVRRLA